MSASLHCTSPPVHFRAAAYYSHIHFITTFNFEASGNHVGTNKLRFWVTTGSPILIRYHLHVSSDLPKGKTQLNLFLVRDTIHAVMEDQQGSVTYLPVCLTNNNKNGIRIRSITTHCIVLYAAVWYRPMSCKGMVSYHAVLNLVLKCLIVSSCMLLIPCEIILCHVVWQLISTSGPGPQWQTSS